MTEQTPPKRKRYVSKEERKKRSERMKKYWADKRNKDRMFAKLKGADSEQELVATTKLARVPKYGHRKTIRKDNIEIAIDYRPWAHQYRLSKAIDAGRRFIAFVAGIRSGKSYAGARECLRQIYGAKRKVGLGWIVAPTYGLSEIAQRAFEEASGAKLILKKRRSPSPEYLMRPAKDGEPPFLVQVKTAENPDRLRGAEVDWVWWDEAAMCSEETFDILMGRVLTTQGKIWMTTTPTGMSHWLFNEVVQRAQNGDPAYAHIEASTRDNLKLTDADIQKMREKYTDEFYEQEIEGKFVNFSGLIYKDFDQTKHTFDATTIEGTDKADILGGIDWGYDDPFVFLWIAKMGNKYYVLDEYYRSGEIPRTHLNVIKTKPLTPRLVSIFADVSRPESRREFSEGLGKIVLPGRTERDDLIPGIEYVSSLFKQGHLHIASHCRHLITELGKYAWKEKKDANSGDRPRDHHNHCLDALRYALYSDRTAGPARSYVRFSGGLRVVSTARERPTGILKRILKIKSDKKKRNWMSV